MWYASCTGHFPESRQSWPAAEPLEGILMMPSNMIEECNRTICYKSFSIIWLHHLCVFYMYIYIYILAGWALFGPDALDSIKLDRSGQDWLLRWYSFSPGDPELHVPVWMSVFLPLLGSMFFHFLPIFLVILWISIHKDTFWILFMLCGKGLPDYRDLVCSAGWRYAKDPKSPRAGTGGPTEGSFEILDGSRKAAKCDAEKDFRRKLHGNIYIYICMIHTCIQCSSSPFCDPSFVAVQVQVTRQPLFSASASLPGLPRCRWQHRGWVHCAVGKWARHFVHG